MTSEVEALAARVVVRADRQLPADAALRNELRSRRGLSRRDGADISRAVFDFYRWRGWLDPELPTPDQIRSALELAQTFKTRPQDFPDNELIEHAVPEWTGGQMEVTARWIRSIQSEPSLWLRANRDRAETLAAELGATPSASIPVALRYQGDEDLFHRSEFHAGEFEIQDIASQAVGVLCDPKPGEIWWDACAGEGGKTLHLSERMSNQGLIWASDRAAWRLKSLQRRAARAKCFNYRSVLWNGGVKLPTRTQFDGVLVDAPCAGVGTWQRNPHARWTTTPEDVAELGEIQNHLLANVVPSIRHGGRLVYAVCTLTQTETVRVADRFESRFAGFTPLLMKHPFEPALDAARLWLRPELTGGGGMFVAAWRKS